MELLRSSRRPFQTHEVPMRIRSYRALFAAIACGALLTAPAGAQERPSQPRSAPMPESAPTAAAPLSPLRDGLLSGDPAQLFPADVGLYVEIVDLASTLSEVTLEELFSHLEANLEARGPSMPIALPELRALAESRIAIAHGFPGNRFGSYPLVVIRAKSTAAAALIRERLLSWVLPAGTARRSETVAGRSVVVFHSDPQERPAPGAFCYTLVDNVIVVGAFADVSALLGPPPAGFRALQTDSAYSDARRRFSKNLDSFVLINVGGLLRESHLLGGARGAGSPASVIGADGLRGLAIGGSSDGSTGKLEILLELDRSRPSLLSTVFDPAPIGARAPEVIPATSAIAVTASFEPARLFDFIKERVTPDIAMATQLPLADVWARETSARVQMRAREEFLAAIGDEVTFAFDFTAYSAPGATAAHATSAPTRSATRTPRILTFIEVKEPTAARLGLVAISRRALRHSSASASMPGSRSRFRAKPRSRSWTDSPSSGATTT